MKIEKFEKYLRFYLDNTIIPYINAELVGEDDEPITIDIDKIIYGIGYPNRISCILHMEPDWTKGSITDRINLEISNFFKMLGTDKNLHIYWNKRPLS